MMHWGKCVHSMYETRPDWSASCHGNRKHSIWSPKKPSVSAQGLCFENILSLLPKLQSGSRFCTTMHRDHRGRHHSPPHHLKRIVPWQAKWLKAQLVFSSTLLHLKALWRPSSRSSRYQDLGLRTKTFPEKASMALATINTLGVIFHQWSSAGKFTTRQAISAAIDLSWSAYKRKRRERYPGTCSVCSSARKELEDMT